MKKPFFLIVDNVRSLENVGSLFRTADAMSVGKVFLCGITGTPPSHKITKTALGAEEWIPWEYHSQTWRLVKKLQSKKISVVGLAINSIILFAGLFTKDFYETSRRAHAATTEVSAEVPDSH